jgi:hypothetical protein
LTSWPSSRPAWEILWFPYSPEEDSFSTFVMTFYQIKLSPFVHHPKRFSCENDYCEHFLKPVKITQKTKATDWKSSCLWIGRGSNTLMWHPNAVGVAMCHELQAESVLSSFIGCSRPSSDFLLFYLKCMIKDSTRQHLCNFFNFGQ